MDALPATGVIDVVEMLSGPAIMHVVHSHAGAYVACRVLALGTAKQRKKVIKAMKGTAASHSLRTNRFCLAGEWSPWPPVAHQWPEKCKVEGRQHLSQACISFASSIYIHARPGWQAKQQCSACLASNGADPSA